MGLLSFLTPLQQQAIRLMRTRWKSPQSLAEEMFLILLQDKAPTTGPVTIDKGDGKTTAPIDPVAGGVSPLALGFFPDFFLPGDQPADEITDTDDAPAEEDGQPGQRRQRRHTKTITQTRHVRGMVPGKVLSGKGDSYKVALYPNGSRATDDETHQAITMTVAARQLQIAAGETIPAGTWCWVFRYQKVRVITKIRMLGQQEVGRETRFKVAQETHEILVPVWLNG